MISIQSGWEDILAIIKVFFAFILSFLGIIFIIYHENAIAPRFSFYADFLVEKRHCFRHVYRGRCSSFLPHKSPVLILFGVCSHDPTYQISTPMTSNLPPSSLNGSFPKVGQVALTPLPKP